MGILGYQLICGPYRKPPPTDEEALYAEYACGSEVLSPMNPIDEYIFYSWAGSGCASAVSVETGLTVFSGEIGCQATGRITYPTEWRPSSELGSECRSSVSMPTARGYDLTFDGGPILTDTEVESVLRVITNTAVFDAFSENGTIHSAVVILYTREYCWPYPEAMEWIVLINGGP